MTSTPLLIPGTPSPGLIAAHRKAARSVFVALILVGASALLAAGVSYLEDLSQARAAAIREVREAAELQAEALSLHITLLQNELTRLASRREVDTSDSTSTPERLLLETAHHDSALFGRGVAVLGIDGKVEWSEPASLPLGQGPLQTRRWLQRLLAQRAPVVGLLEPDSELLAVAVPVVRKDRITGVLLGVVETARTSVVGGGHAQDPRRQLVLLDSRGIPLLPDAPEWARGPFEASALRSFGSDGDGIWQFGGRELLGAAVPVGTTGLQLAVVGDATTLTGGLRVRVVAQMVTITALLLLSLMLFSLFLRRTSRVLLEMEARAVQQEKLAALGTAATLIAHEVKNSLNGLAAVASLIEGGAPPALPVRTLRGQLDRLKHLASSLLSFGKPSIPAAVEVELAPVVREAVESLRVLPEAAEVELSVKLPESLVVRSDPALLHSAVDNLIRNAIEASVAAKDTGKVQTPRVWVEAFVADGAVKVIVEDNAGGPPPEAESSLFQPFYTSKAKGIGLGLAMARSAVQGHGGELTFSRTPEGSRFTISFPQELHR